MAQSASLNGIIGTAERQETRVYGINWYYLYFQYYRTGDLGQYAIGNTFLNMLTCDVVDKLNSLLIFLYQRSNTTVPKPDKKISDKNLTIITTHINADFDALASMLAAQKLYPEALVVFPGSQ